MSTKVPFDRKAYMRDYMRKWKERNPKTYIETSKLQQLKIRLAEAEAELEYLRRQMNHTESVPNVPPVNELPVKRVSKIYR